MMNYMAMPIPNSFMNLNDPNLEVIINPFKEKIKKLEEEIMTKDLEIAQLKYKIIQMNNIQSNQMNINNNMMNPKEIKMKKFKRLNLKFNIEENDNNIVIQSRSDDNDKIEKPIDVFCNKARYKKEDLKFLIIGDNIVKMESTIEENGICNDKSYYILVKKKTENDIMEEKKENDEYEYEKEKDKDIEI